MRTIRHYVDRRAAEQPHDIWLIAPETGETMPFAQLRLNSIDLTRFLLAAGLKKGDKVALMLHNSYQTARLLIGVMYGGFMVAPLNLLAQPSQLSYVLQHSDTKIIFTTAEFSDRLETALAGVDHGITIIAIDPDTPSLFENTDLPELALPEVAECCSTPPAPPANPRAASGRMSASLARWSRATCISAATSNQRIVFSS